MSASWTTRATLDVSSCCVGVAHCKSSVANWRQITLRRLVRTTVPYFTIQLPSWLRFYVPGKLHILGLLLTDYITLLLDNERQSAEEMHLLTVVGQGVLAASLRCILYVRYRMLVVVASSEYTTAYPSGSSQRRINVIKRGRPIKPNATVTSQRRVAVTTTASGTQGTSHAQLNNNCSNLAPAAPPSAANVAQQQCFPATRAQTTTARPNTTTPRIETSGATPGDERCKSGIRSLLTSVPTPSYSCHMSEQASSCDINNNSCAAATSADNTAAAVPATLVVTSQLDCSNVTSADNSLSIDCSFGPDLTLADVTSSVEQNDVNNSQTFANPSDPNNVIFLTSSIPLTGNDGSTDVTSVGHPFVGVSVKKSELQNQFDCYSHCDVSQTVESGDASQVGVAGVTSERNCFGKRVFSAQELQQKKNSKRIIDNMLMRETLRDIFLSHAGANNSSNGATPATGAPARSSSIASTASSATAGVRSGGQQKQQREVTRVRSVYPQT